MAVLLSEHQVAYFPVPKCACSSFKRMIYKMNTGRPWRRPEDGKNLHSQDGYRTVKFGKSRKETPSGWQTFAIVRDPQSRLLSAYRSKVLKRREKTLRNMDGAVELPDSFEGFVEALDELQKASSIISHHTQPLAVFLGDDPRFFDRLFDMAQTHRAVAWLSETTGREVNLPHVNRSPVEEEIEVSERVARLIETRFESDLEFLERARSAGRLVEERGGRAA